MPVSAATPPEETPKPKSDRDSGGGEVASLLEDVYDLDLPLAARNLSVAVPGVFTGLTRLFEQQTWALPGVIGVGCATLVFAGPFYGVLAAGSAGVLSVAALQLAAYWSARRARLDYEAKVALETVRRDTICLLCGDEYGFGRRPGPDGGPELWILPRGCASCGKSVCLACARQRRRGPADGLDAPVLEKLCPTCEDPDGRWEFPPG